MNGDAHLYKNGWYPWMIAKGIGQGLAMESSHDFADGCYAEIGIGVAELP